MIIQYAATVVVLLLMLTQYRSCQRNIVTTTATSTATNFTHPPSPTNITHLPPCKQPISPKHLFLAIFSTAVLLVGLSGNLVAVTVITTSRQLRKHATYLLLASLGVADLGVSVFVTTVKVDMYLNNGSFCHDHHMCVFFHLTDCIFPIASITNILIIALDRWYAISHPYTYIVKVTFTRTRWVILSIWFYSLVWALLGIVNWDSPLAVSYSILAVGVERYCYIYNRNYYTAVMVAVFLTPMVVTTVLYAVVLYTSVKQVAAISKQGLNKGKGVGGSSRVKCIKTVGIVFVAYTVCWLPHTVVVIVQYWFPDLMDQFLSKNALYYDVVTTIISNVLPPINSCINPFIYFIYSCNFRVAVKDLLFKIMKSPRHALNMYGEETRAVRLLQRN